MRRRRSVKAVKSFGRDIDRGHKTERKFRRRQIVIDCFRDADNWKSSFMKLFGDAKRTFAAEHNEGLDLQNIEICKSFADRHSDEELISIASNRPLEEVVAEAAARGRRPIPAGAEE